ncbi:MAG: efflux RND transporter periplasmic adaptor subunit [Verrucomicrobiae bacterium]|nr:efflux RND transporter periplasmic adaptor subunit [Verrucomicrobiae bacterium]
MQTANRTKRRKIVVLGLICLSIAALASLAVFREREPFIVVQTDRVARRDLTEVVSANGKIQPVVQVVISPEVAGEIVALPVKEGQRVKKGDLLVQIKPDAYIATRNSAEANYKSALASMTLARAELEKAEAEYKRNLELFNNKLVSESLFLEYKTAYEAAKLRYQMAVHQADQAKFGLDKATEDLNKTTILSPMDGTITRLRSQIGERVLGTSFNLGTEIMTIANLDEMEARVEVGETDVVLISPGQKASLEVDAFKGRKFTGVVTEVSNAPRASGLQAGLASSQSQDIARFEVRIRITEKEAFRPGMSVSAEIETRYRTNVLSVPLASVTTRMLKVSRESSADTGSTARAHAANSPGALTSPARTNDPVQAANFKGVAKPQEVVFVVNGDRVKMVPVKLGISDGTYWEIVEGLEEGQEIVSGGYKAISRDLDDGRRIRRGKVTEPK